jgi:hypothetical protein
MGQMGIWALGSELGRHRESKVSFIKDRMVPMSVNRQRKIGLHRFSMTSGKTSLPKSIAVD